MRFAQAIVVEGNDAREVWEDVSATLGDNNNLLADGHSCVFVGDPHEIADRDKYDSLKVGQAIIRAEPGKASLPLEEAPDPVHTVAVQLRGDGLYLFADHGAAAAFADAVALPGAQADVGVGDLPVNYGKGAEELIAGERAALMEDLGLPTLAEDVREHQIGLETLLVRLSSIPDTSEARALLGHWIEVDADREIPEGARPFNLLSADSVGVDVWIALDCEGRPTEPRKVASIHDGGAQLIFCFADEDPPAKFNFDELLWQRTAHQPETVVS
jgi:hypothetical protein